MGDAYEAVASSAVVQNVGGWLKGFQTGAEEQKPRGRNLKVSFGGVEALCFESDYDPWSPVRPLEYQLLQIPRKSLREPFADIVQERYRENIGDELDDIELDITTAINGACKFLDETERDFDDDEFPGSKQKIPLVKLFPGLAKTKAKKAAPKA